MQKCPQCEEDNGNVRERCWFCGADLPQQPSDSQIQDGGAVASKDGLGEPLLTLTAQEIRHLAQFCGMVLQEPTASEAEDERETEIVIAPWPEKGVKGDEGMLTPHKHIAYLAEYTEEGCVPLGSPNEKLTDPTKLNRGNNLT